jgi:uncharacterized protein (TIGR03000 family)
MKKEEVPAPKKTGLDTAPATIVVNVPAEAKVTIDDNATTSTGARRVFVSPALQPGQEYHYTLKAEFVRDGKAETRSERIAVKAGQETTVNLTAAVAAR